MFKEIFFEEEKLKKLNYDFLHAGPFPYVCIDDFLDVTVADSLLENFPALPEMDVNYEGLNEHKGEHSSFDTLHENFNKVKEMLSSESFKKNVEAISGIKNLETINDRYGNGLSQGGSGSFLDIHIDYNLHPLKKKERRLNLLIFLNKNWQKEWGGYLEFWNASRSECIVSIEPKFNRCVLFICNNISYHGYSLIKCPAPVTRKSFYLYFFSEPEKKLLYHDTVFTTAPNDTFFHKYRVRIKEFFKNSAKRILYYSGLNKFLK